MIKNNLFYTVLSDIDYIDYLDEMLLNKNVKYTVKILAEKVSMKNCEKEVKKDLDCLVVIGIIKKAGKNGREILYELNKKNKITKLLIKLWNEMNDF